MAVTAPLPPETVSPLAQENGRNSALERLVTAIPWVCATLAALGWAAGAPWLEGNDEAIYSFVGRSWVHGVLPYRDAFEAKPPGVFLLWAGVWRFLGGSLLAGRLVGLALTVAAALLFGLAARRLWSSPRGLAAAPLLVVATCVAEFGGPFADTETLGVFFVALALWLIAGADDGSGGSWRLPAAGLCAGLALMSKQVLGIEVLIALPLLAALSGRQRALPRVLVFWAGAVVPPLASALFFASQGAWADFRLGVVGTIFARGLRPDDSLGSSARVELLQYALVQLTEPAVLVLVVLAAAALLWPSDRRDGRPWVLAAWTLLVLGAIFLQGRGYGHQFKQMLPPLALLACYACAGFERAGSGAVRRLGATLVAVCLLVAVLLQGLVLGGTVAYLRHGGAADPSFGARAEVKAAILANTGPEDRIWCCPNPEFYLATHRLAAATHFHPYFLGLPGTVDQTLQQLAQNRPKVIVLAPDSEKLRVGMTEDQVQAFLKRLRVLLDQGYRLQGKAGLWEIYTLRGA